MIDLYNDFGLTHNFFPLLGTNHKSREERNRSPKKRPLCMCHPMILLTFKTQSIFKCPNFLFSFFFQKMKEKTIRSSMKDSPICNDEELNSGMFE